MKVFLSHSSSDRSQAEALRQALEREGMPVATDPGGAGAERQRKVEELIRSADAVVVLVGSHKEPDEGQSLAWRAALEAAWADPGMRLLPVLLPGAEVPAFLWSAAEAEDMAMVRVADPRDMEGAARAVLAALGQTARKDSWRSFRGLGEEAYSVDDDFPTVRGKDLKEEEAPSRGPQRSRGSKGARVAADAGDQARRERRARLAELAELAGRVWEKEK